MQKEAAEKDREAAATVVIRCRRTGRTGTDFRRHRRLHVARDRVACTRARLSMKIGVAPLLPS